MLGRWMGRGALAAVTLVLLGSAPACADAIYGCWSRGDERLHVDFTSLVTPGGASPEARIDRHSASYVIPEGERDAGARVLFRQLNDEEVARSLGDADGGQATGATEIWTPCGAAETS